MKKFMVIYHAPQSLMEQTANSTPEEMEKGMEGWMLLWVIFSHLTRRMSPPPPRN